MRGKPFLKKSDPRTQAISAQGAKATQITFQRRHKFNAVKTTVNGIAFDSKAEAFCYGQLRLLEKAGEIEGLELQPKFPLIVNGVKVATYIADFRYRVVKGISQSLTVVRDVKGVRTPVYQLKKKLVRALYGIDITDT